MTTSSRIVAACLFLGVIGASPAVETVSAARWFRPRAKTHEQSSLNRVRYRTLRASEKGFLGRARHSWSGNLQSAKLRPKVREVASLLQGISLREGPQEAGTPKLVIGSLGDHGEVAVTSTGQWVRVVRTRHYGGQLQDMTDMVDQWSHTYPLTSAQLSALAPTWDPEILLDRALPILRDRLGKPTTEEDGAFRYLDLVPRTEGVAVGAEENPLRIQWSVDRPADESKQFMIVNLHEAARAAKD